MKNISQNDLKVEYQLPPGRKSISRVSDVKFPLPSGLPSLLTSNSPAALFQIMDHLHWRLLDGNEKKDKKRDRVQIFLYNQLCCTKVLSDFGWMIIAYMFHNMYVSGNRYSPSPIKR